MPYALCVVGPTLPADSDVEVMVDDTLTLTVNITDFNLPLTEINWFIDDDSVTETGMLIITNTSTTSPPATSTLTLSPVQFPNEGGLYSVRAVNLVGMNTTVFTVTVTCKLYSVIICVYSCTTLASILYKSICNVLAMFNNYIYN